MKTRQPFFIFQLGIFFIFFLNIPESNSQPFWEWEAKTPLTDSVSDNINPYLLHLYSDSQGEMVTMVWEKSTDPISTAIYFRNLISTDEPQIVVYNPGVHFTHPKILKIYDSFDFLFYVFYQSDQNGNQDIYYMKYGVDGQFTGPFPFATSEFDENEFEAGNDSYWDRSFNDRFIVSILTWTSNGDLVTCNLEKNGEVFSFSEPEVLDSGNCSSPVIVNDEMIYYIREDETGSFIYYIPTEYPSGNWGEPVLFFNGGNCFNLAEDNVYPSYIAWSADSNAVYRNYIASSWPPYYGYAVGPEQDTPLDPAICTLVIGVEPEALQFNEYYMAFPYQENLNNEIFMNQGYNWGDPEFFNFSQSNTENRNPEFYLGEISSWNVDCFYVYLIWEELRNEHWQILSSKTVMCVGGIDENAEKENFIMTYPNPFIDKVNITYTISAGDYIQINVNDIYGRNIRNLFNGKQCSGQQLINWDGRDNSGNRLPPGLYLISLTTGTQKYSTRILRIN